MADADLLREARERYAAGVDADRLNRIRDQEDRKFYTGGDEQWTVDGKNIAAVRRKDGRPADSYNRLPQFVKQVSGELRQNKPAIKVLPVDGQTDPEMAEVYSAIIRNIEGQSNGHRVYAKAGEQAAIGGQAWWRLKAAYCSDEGFDQELLIERIPNPLAVVCDPAAREPTRCDMKWGFVTELVPKADFLAKYPDINASDFDNTDQLKDWVEGDFIRIAEYWRQRSTGTKKLYALKSRDGRQIIANEDELKQHGLKKADPEELAALGLTLVSTREVESFQVECITVCGAGELDEWKPWPGKYIPLVRVVGEEVEAGDTVFRHGMIHHAKAPQVGYNYARNAMMERHGQSTKAPWLATAKMIQNYKGMWETANTKNHAVLIYDADPSIEGARPIRTDPPQLDAAAYQESMIASEDMKATTGIYDAALGAKSNETSGVAIQRRDAQGDTATFVYIDNLEDAIETTGRQLIDLIPHYYSDERVIRIIGEDGEVEKFVEINKIMPDGKAWNDVTRGKYDVVVSTGPAYTTRRQEAAEALLKLSENPLIGQVGSDILVRAMDIPMGDKLADRLKKMLPSGIDEDVDKERAQQPQQPQQPSAEQLAMQNEAQATQQKLQLQAQEAQQKIMLMAQDQDARQALARDQFEFEAAMALNKHALAEQIAAHGAALKTGQAMHSAALDTATASHDAALNQAQTEHGMQLSEDSAQASQELAAQKQQQQATAA